jgi:hypothetical protein
LSAFPPLAKGGVTNSLMEIDMSEENEISAESVVEAIVRGDAPNGEYVLDGRTIKGKFDLSNRVISIAIRITNCTFEDEVDLSNCEFKQCVDFSVSRFKKEFYSRTIYQKDIICSQATFADEVSFNGCQCKLDAEFDNAQFENAEKDIDFIGAKFGIEINCAGTIFNGGANFNSIQCEGIGFFENAKFENVKKNIDFSRARFGSDLNCNKVIFKGGANFNSIQCEEYGFFRDAKFENVGERIDFTHTKFGVNLEFQNATFAGDVDFLHAQVSRSFILRNTKFGKHVNLNCVNLHNFSLMDTRDRYGSDSLPFNGDVNLQRLSFNVFQGTKEQQRHVVEKQAPDKFSIDPYLQFEKYYNSIGDDSNAKDVYYEGRKKLRENARIKANPDINWSWGKLIFDWLNWIFLGYGIKLWHTFCALAGFLLLGILAFWSDEAMVPKSISARTPGFIMAIEPEFQIDFDKSVISDNLRQRFKDNSIILTQQAYIEIEKNGREWDIFNYPLYDVQYKAKLKENGIKIYNTTYFMKHLFYRFGYSLNMLIPVVNLRIADEYKFPSNWDGVCSVFRGFYTIVHILAGWVLIPLLISSLAGVLRKR